MPTQTTRMMTLELLKLPASTCHLRSVERTLCQFGRPCARNRRAPASVGPDRSPAMHSSRVVAIAAAGLMGSAVLMAGAIGAVSASVAGGGSAGGGAAGGSASMAGRAQLAQRRSGRGGAAGAGSSNAAPSAIAVGEIPAAMLALYQAAAATMSRDSPGRSLAAIGTVESANGTSDLPGVHSGANGAGAEGPMQFEPRTFAAYALPVPPGGVTPPSPYDPADAVYAAARMLCANGAAGGTDVPAAVFAYNHDDAYVAEVLSLAGTFEQVAPPVVSTSTVGATAVAWALAQVGTPYIWGGETPGVGFDCSGLVQAAYNVAGVALPRVAQEQFDATPALTQGTVLQPGDLVFFGTGPRDVSHVGLYIGVQAGRTMMVDAPHTGSSSSRRGLPGRARRQMGQRHLHRCHQARFLTPFQVGRRRGARPPGVYNAGRRGVPHNR